MNGNPFYVSPLGGLDLGQTVGGIYNAYNRRQEIDEQKAMQEQQVQQQKAQQAEMQDLAMRMQQGDIAAGQEFYSKYPERAAMVDKGMGVRDENQAKQIGGFFEKLIAIPDLKGKRDFLQKTAGQTPFTIDDDLLAMDDETLQNSINITAPRYLNKEQISMLQGGGSGGTQAQKDFEYFQKLKERNPELANQFGIERGYIQTGREEARTPQERNLETYQRLKAEGRDEEARQFGQSAGLVTKEGRELSAHLQKRLSSFTDEAAESSANEIKYNDLAEQIIQAGDEIGSGFFEAGWGEKMKEFTGTSDWKTQLRKDVQQIKVSEGIKNLPQGPATDKDIELVMKPFPPDTASAEYIASYLRGLAKLSNYRKQYNDFKANYVSENGTERGMLKAWKEEGITPELSQREEGFNEAQAQIRNVGRFQVQEVN